MNVKIAVSVPDTVYRKAERVAKPADVKAQLDQVYGAESARLDEIVGHMQSLSLPREDW